MASSVVSSNSAPNCSSYEKPISKNLTLWPSSISFPLHKTRLCAIKTRPDGGDVFRSSQNTTAHGADLLRKPTASMPAVDDNEDSDKEHSSGGDGGTWMDWEDMILADTVPLVGLVRMILHSPRYESGGRLSPEHEKAIINRLLAYHPECEKKIGCGIDYITIGYHPNFESSRCLFIVRKDGEFVDFSYWKCIKGLIRKNYPLYADTFILRHFRRSKR